MGLETFATAFADHADQYVLIGGTACELVMEEAGVSFRATKDFDIVLSAHELSSAFVQKLWQFIEVAQYASHETSEEPSQFYRFKGPKALGFPHMLELFSRKPVTVELVGTSHLTPIPVPGDVASLSAILLDDDYETLIRGGARKIQGVSVVGPHELVLLKSRAWLDLTAAQTDGAKGLSKHIKKHRNDVFRLYQVLDPSNLPEIHGSIRSDFSRFLTAMWEEDVPLKDLGVRGVQPREVVSELRRLYGIDRA